jgi:hypothetical protein
MRDAVNNFGSSWAEIKESAEHGCWMILCLYLVQDFESFEKLTDIAVKEVVHLMNELNWMSTLEL